MPRFERSRWSGTWLRCCAGVLSLGTAGAAVADAAELVELSLEQLREIVVSSVSRREESLDDVAASVFVISAEDLRRSGATTLPEALRLAPQLNVAGADSSRYAISARGFNNVLANRMLVMIDGRTVYTPLFSGVFWEAQDVVLEDVERIEVISGPSTALWGTNGVNGLINIITRPAAATQGPAALLHAGNRERGAALRHGGRLGADGRYRLYAKSYDRRPSERADGSRLRDAADGVQAGFRADWSGARDSVSLSGDLYQGSLEQLPAARRISGGNLLGQWRRTLEGGAQASAQLYLDRAERDHPQIFAESLDTADLVVQYAFRPAAGHRLLVGGGYRSAHDKVRNSAGLAFLPASRSLDWARLFAQDQVSLGKRLSMTVSASLERNPYGSSEFMPSLRLAWRASEALVGWGSLSRAARAPSRIDREFFQPAQPPFQIAGGPNFRSELSDVIELGVRGQPMQSLSYSLTLFHHRHRRLRSLAPTPQGLQLENGIEGTTAGAEGWISWRALPHWRLSGGGVVLRQDLRVAPGALDIGGLAALGNDPPHWWSLRSVLDLTPAHAWDVSVRGVGALPNPRVPAYTAVDTRLAWRFEPRSELSLLLKNLFDRRHAQWGVAPERVEYGRAASLQWRWGW